MKKLFKRIVFAVALSPVVYLVVALLFTHITVNTKNLDSENKRDNSIYIKTNGVHLDLILSNNEFDFLNLDCNYLAIGWGDKDFYLNTPSFSDLKIKTAFNALFLESPTLLHVTKYHEIQNNWTEIQITEEQLISIKRNILNYFNPSNLKPIQGYGSSDFFYQAKGSYSCFFTCNSWVNSILKQANVKASLWTPFSYRLITLHRN